MSADSAPVAPALPERPELWLVAGWQPLLPPLAGRRVLCVDAQGWVAALLTVPGAQVEVACPQDSVPQVRQRLASLGRAALPVHGVAPGPGDGSSAAWVQRLRTDGTAPFDGLVVVHAGVLVPAEAQGRLPRQAPARLAALAEALLKPNGFLHVESLNRWGLRGGGNASDPEQAQTLGRAPLAATALQRALRRRGWQDVRLHPYLLSRDRLEEVLPPRGYAATKNRTLPRERLKEWLFGTWGARHLAHAHGVLAQRVGRLHSVQDAILERLQPPAPAPRLRPVKQMVFHSQKQILVLQPDGDPDADGGAVVVVSSDAVVTRRRDREAQVLDQLARLPALIAQRVPRLLDRFQVDGHDCFVLSRLPGLTLEADVAPLAPVTASAVAFLVALCRHGAAPRTVDAALFQQIVAQPFAAAAEAVPGLRADLARLQHALQPALLGRTLPVGWWHGDFKVENVTYDPQQLEVVGVLDWEHAGPCGLAYVDLLYLLVYNRQIRGESALEAFRQLVLERRLSDEELRLEQHFLVATGTPADLRCALGALFLVHHVGVRLGLVAWTDAELAPVRELLLACQAGGPAAADRSDGPPPRWCGEPAAANP